MAKKLTQEEWVAKAKIIHNNRYDYSKTKYIHSKTRVTIICSIHGEFSQIPNQHLFGYGCKKCAENSRRKSHEGYIKKAKEVHNNRYEYIPGSYRGGVHKVKVICPVHGEFSVRAKDHIGKLKTGCRKCAVNDLRYTTASFINKAIKKHGNVYDYSDTIYIQSDSKVTIRCKIHGNFRQMATDHIQGVGCPTCAQEHTGWTYTRWQEQAERSTRFDSYKVYVLRCYNDKENFFKVGKTFLTVANRYSSSISIPYEYEVVDIIEGSARHISELEHKIHRASKDYRYSPTLPFGGDTECFSKVLVPNGVKQATAITYSRLYGEVARNIVSIAEVEG